MAINIAGETKRIGMALSGGGFRAAAFHLGALRKLADLGLLETIDVLSCVSGGSIAGAYLTKHWAQQGALDGLEDYLLTRSIGVGSVLGGLVDPFHSRLDKLAQSYDRDLFHGAKLEDLLGGPRLYLNTTNVATGNLFFFVTGGGKQAEMGEHELGVKPAQGFSVARAVAASSAFPPVFPPLRLDPDEYEPGGAVEYVALTDGGVYDNLGVNPLLSEVNCLDYAIVSDAGSPFAIDDRPTELGMGVVAALVPVMMEQVRGLQFEKMKWRHAANQKPMPLWFSIDSHQGEDRPGDAEIASGVGTNLKKLSRGELDLLTRHGAALLFQRLRQYAPELVHM